MSTRSEKVGAIIGLSIFAITMGLLYLSIFEKEAIKSAFLWLQGVVESIGAWNYLIVILASTIESFPVIGALVPGQNVMFISGGFYSNIDFFGITTMAIIGAILGNYIGYILGYIYGPNILFKYGDYIGIGKTEYEYIKKGMNKYGFFAIMFSKFHPTFRAIIPFVAGASKMAPKNFIIYNIVGSAVWGTTIILIGKIFVDNYEVVIDNFGKIMTGILLAIIAYIFTFKKEEFKKYLLDKQNEINERVNQNSK